MKKRRKIFVSMEASQFQFIFKQGTFEIVDSPVPLDAKYIGVHYDWQIDRFLICFEHKSFEPIPEGQCLPIVESIKLIRKSVA